jgi:group I intron endonuclease
MDTGVIYKLTSPSGKAYIGQTRQQVSKRMRAHCTTSRCHAVSAAIKKYGWERMQLEILVSGVSAERLNAEEEQCIRLHGTASPNGYNLLAPSRQPYKASNHKNLKAAVQAYNAANPESQRAKQNVASTVSKRRAGWRMKREQRCAGMTEKERWAEYVKCRASAKLAAKNAAKRCAGTGRNPMAEWEAEYGSDTDERKAHIEYQRRMRGKAKGDSSRAASNLHPLASSGKSRGKRKQANGSSGSIATSVPKSPPSCASTGVGERAWLLPSSDDGD